MNQRLIRSLALTSVLLLSLPIAHAGQNRHDSHHQWPGDYGHRYHSHTNKHGRDGIIYRNYLATLDRQLLRIKKMKKNGDLSRHKARKLRKMNDAARSSLKRLYADRDLTKKERKIIDAKLAKLGRGIRIARQHNKSSRYRY